MTAVLTVTASIGALVAVSGCAVLDTSRTVKTVSAVHEAADAFDDRVDAATTVVYTDTTTTGEVTLSGWYDPSTGIRQQVEVGPTAGVAYAEPGDPIVITFTICQRFPSVDPGMELYGDAGCASKEYDPVLGMATPWMGNSETSAPWFLPMGWRLRNSTGKQQPYPHLSAVTNADGSYTLTTVRSDYTWSTTYAFTDTGATITDSSGELRLTLSDTPRTPFPRDTITTDPSDTRFEYSIPMTDAQADALARDLTGTTVTMRPATGNTVQ